MKKIHTVFAISLSATLILTVLAIFLNDEFSKVSNMLFTVITKYFSWLYLLAMLAFVIFILMLACTKYGNIRLGANDSKPEYSTFSWFAMLFCAGMGVGLVFWGISEPIAHFTNPMGVRGGTAEAVEFSFKSVFMHWGIQPWANYAVVGLSLAYFQFRKNKPGLMSSVIEPLIGRKEIRQFVGRLTDILAAFATVAGIVTSLGLGVLQINSGLNMMMGIPNNLTVQIAIIAIVTAIFMWSAISGINKGVKILSNFNIVLALILMAGAFIIGPKLEIINNLVNGVGNYIGNFIRDSLVIPVYGDRSWIEAWRVFYWAWWIAWAPFVGIFIAHISKGRTIREFVVGVVLAPTLASVVWFAIFGTLGVHLGMTGALSGEALQRISSMPETGLFTVFSLYPFGNILSLAAIVLLLTFFITSADSGTYVLAILSSEGNLDPPNYKKIVWGIVQSALAVGLLIAGGLKPLQTISIVAAFPFMFIMFAACVSLIKELKKES